MQLPFQPLQRSKIGLVMVFKKIIILILPLFVVQCKFRDASQVDHIDVNWQERGAESAAPWHFHTGVGMRFGGGGVDVMTGEVDKNAVRCNVLTAKPGDGCKEKVYFYTADEITKLVNMAYDAFEKEMKLHAAMAAGSVAMVALISKGTATAAVIPEPAFSKAIAAAGLVANSVLVLYITYETYKAIDRGRMMAKLNNLFDEEKAYVRRCEHVSKDFRTKAIDLGVHFQFLDNGGSWIDAIHYQESVKAELALYEATLKYATDKGISPDKAYQQYFSKQCGQLPSRYATPGEIRFKNQWSALPAAIGQNAIRASNAMKLDNGAMIEFLNFDSNDFNATGEQNSTVKFLKNIATAFESIDKNGTESEKAKLAKFRRDYKRVFIQTRWGRRDTFKSGYVHYDAVELSQGNDLFINALWWSWTSDYQISLKRFFSEKLGIDPARFQVP